MFVFDLQKSSEYIDSSIWAHLMNTAGFTGWSLSPSGLKTCQLCVSPVALMIGDWDNGHCSFKIAEIPLYFSVKHSRAREVVAAKSWLCYHVPCPQFYIAGQHCFVVTGQQCWSATTQHCLMFATANFICLGSSFLQWNS